jgi:hypothetical protein
MAEKQWCPGCSREVEGVCHHFNCAIGPNGLDAQSRSSAGSGHTEAEGYAASLRQMAQWADDAIAPDTPDSQRIDIGDIDTDELRAAANYIERIAGLAQSPVVWGATQEDVVAHAIMMDDGCGLTINGQRTLCDDPRAMEEPDRCYCRRSAKAALAALAAQPTAAPVEPTLSEIIREKMKQMAAEAGHFPSSAERAQALRLLMAEDERQSKLHDLLETIREQIRTGVEPEHRPGGLFKNIQDAVYAMRGRTRLMDDAAITKIFDGQQEARKPPIETTGNGTGNGRTIKPELTGSPSGTPHGAGVFVPPAGRWVVGKNGWDASDEATREDI